jgi:predicted dehydrogenase
MLEICGEHGDLRTDRSTVGWRARGRRRFETVEPVPVPEGEALRYPQAGMVSMFRQFADAVGRGTAPETSGADNLWTLAMLEASIRSTETGRYVSIDETLTAEMKARAGLAGEG